MAVQPVTAPLRDQNKITTNQFAQPRRKWLSHKVMWAYIFIAPSVLFLLLFALTPILFSGWVSLHNWDMITPIPKMKWIGLDNFTYLFNNDKIFRIAIRNTFTYALFGVGINTVLGLAGALLLNSKIRFSTFWRSIYFLPIVTAPMALGMMWSALLNKNFGLVNSLLGLIHIPSQSFMYSPDTALATLIGIVVYQNVGYYIIIYLAGLQGIPQEYYDAAAVDGANKVQSFRYITLPQLRPVLLFLLITNTIGALQVFDIVFAMTDGTELSGGGPVNATMVIVLYMYNTAFKFFKMGRASAMAIILFAIIFLITLFQFRLLRDRK
jgi:multiple sugar transport system permease protein